jgi:hypothetical protein
MPKGKKATWAAFGLDDRLLKAVAGLKWADPTPIQVRRYATGEKEKRREEKRREEKRREEKRREEKGR